MKKLLRYLKPYRLLAFISPLMMIGEVSADLCLPYLMSYIVNYGVLGISVNDPENGSALAASLLHFFAGSDPSRLSMILTFGLLMLAVTLVGGFFGTFCAWTAASASQGFGNDLRCDAFRHVMSLSIEQTDRFTTGSLVTRMTNDVSQLVDFVETVLRMFVRSPMFFIGGTIMVLTLDVRFSFVLLCALPVLIIAIFLIVRRAVPLFSVVQKKLDKVNAVVQENVGGARVVKAYTREEYECERFGSANREMRDANLRVSLLLANISPLLTLVQSLAIVAIIWIGGFRANIEASGMTVGAVMAAITYVTQVINSVMMITMMFQSVSRAMASAERINEVLGSEPAVVGGKETEGPDRKTAVEFRNVSFRYPGTTGKNVLSGINLKIRRGETLAVIGETGSGKSSLVQLIPRFYDATEGEVLVNGRSVRDYTLSALRKKIGFVMQKSELFSDTIAKNIRWGKPDADDTEVRAAADAAQASDFVLGFNDGFDTFIAEKGASLSGGQKQRLSVSRALIRKPEILILDDSTSALDLATEAKLQRAVKERFAGTTVIMIAQRIASVRSADRIAVIESDGRILHCAPHDELMKISDTYRDIYESQMRSGALAEGGGN
ncbi:MAG: ABC transporter ATP-binding protein [Eubacteriales bacterium]